MERENRVMLKGMITEEPEYRQVDAGPGLLTFRIAVANDYRNSSGALIDAVCVFDIAVWGRAASVGSKKLHKGTYAMVRGTLQWDRWNHKGQALNRQRIHVVGLKNAVSLDEPASNSKRVDHPLIINEQKTTPVPIRNLFESKRWRNARIN